jgi:hypothetical protein
MALATLLAANATRPSDPELSGFEYSFAAALLALAILVAIVSVILVWKRKRVQKAATDPGDLGARDWERPQDDARFRKDIGQSRTEPPGKDRDFHNY